MRLPPALRVGLSTRLFLAILATAVLAVLLVGAATRWNFERVFLGYLNGLAVERVPFVLSRLGRAYAEQGQWDFLRGAPGPWFDIVRPVVGEELPKVEEPGDFLRSDLTGGILRLGLLDAQLQRVAGYRYITADMPRWPVTQGERTVGWLVVAPFQSVADSGAQRFGQAMLRASVVASLVAVVMAALLAWWVSRRLLAPVRRVAAATHQLAAGHHDVRVQVNSDDEVGQLARDFNHLAHTLERNEALRREFVADVSHELRTPLAVLRGELEALEDGIRPLNPQAVASLQGEVKQLGQLVDDLYDLALTDVGALSYRMAPLDLGALLRDIGAAHQHRIADKGLRFTLTLPDTPLPVQADGRRLQQLFDNLLENCRRYTDAPGEIRLSAVADGAFWRIETNDTPPGVPGEQLAELFERFYRVDGSRSRATGGAGLGLAIARNIVLAHEGEISASASGLGGVCIAIRLPRTAGAAA